MLKRTITLEDIVDHLLEGKNDVPAVSGGNIHPIKSTLIRLSNEVLTSAESPAFLARWVHAKVVLCKSAASIRYYCTCIVHENGHW